MPFPKLNSHPIHKRLNFMCWSTLHTENKCVVVECWKIDEAAALYATLNSRRSLFCQHLIVVEKQALSSSQQERWYLHIGPLFLGPGLVIMLPFLDYPVTIALRPDRTIIVVVHIMLEIYIKVFVPIRPQEWCYLYTLRILLERRHQAS